MFSMQTESGWYMWTISINVIRACFGCVLWFVWILFSDKTQLQKKRNVNSVYPFLSCSWSVLCNGYSLELTGKTRFPCGGWGEVHFPHPVPNTNLLFFSTTAGLCLSPCYSCAQRRSDLGDNDTTQSSWSYQSHDWHPFPDWMAVYFIVPQLIMANYSF